MGESVRTRHIFDDGVCATCQIEERKYNPLQPRDPGGEDGGQWTKSPGGAAKAAAEAIVSKAYKVSGGSVDVGFNRDGTVTLHDGHGGAATFSMLDLDGAGDSRYRKSLRARLGAVVDAEPGGRTAMRTPKPGSAGQRVQFGYPAGFEKVREGKPGDKGWDDDEDNWDLDVIKLHLQPPSGDGSEDALFSGPGVEMTVRDAYKLIDDQISDQRYRTVRTSLGENGDVDIYRDGRNVVIKPDTAAPELQLPAPDYRRLANALSAVYDFDEADDDVRVQQRKVQTSQGAFLVNAFRDGEDNVTAVAVTWGGEDSDEHELTAHGAHALDFLLAFDRPLGAR